MLIHRARWGATFVLLATAAAAFGQPPPGAGSAVASLGSAERSVPPGPAGDPRLEEARALADRGYELFIQGDYVEAIALFEQAEKLSHSPVILSFIAQSYEALGKLIEARDHYAQIVAEDLGDNAP